MEEKTKSTSHHTEVVYTQEGKVLKKPYISFAADLAWWVQILIVAGPCLLMFTGLLTVFIPFLYY